MRVLYHNWKLPSWKEVPFEGGRGTSGKGEKGSSGQHRMLLIARYGQDRFRNPNLTLKEYFCEIFFYPLKYEH